ncbi:hypothetical protein ACKS0A_04225 [Histoplasma ohiense]
MSNPHHHPHSLHLHFHSDQGRGFDHSSWFRIPMFHLFDSTLSDNGDEILDRIGSREKATYLHIPPELELFAP